MQGDARVDERTEPREGDWAVADILADNKTVNEDAARIYEGWDDVGCWVYL